MDKNTMKNISATTAAAQGTAPVTLPDGYLADGYTSPNPKYVIEWAVEIAEKLAPMDREIFRQMYWSVGSICCRDYTTRRMAVCKLESIASNLVKKGKAPELLIEFCRANIAVTTNAAAIEYFVMHLEAIYCYMR